MSSDVRLCVAHIWFPHSKKYRRTLPRRPRERFSDLRAETMIDAESQEALKPCRQSCRPGTQLTSAELCGSNIACCCADVGGYESERV